MNKKNFNVTGAERKEMAQVVGKAIGIEPVYKRMPTCAYAVNNITISRTGELIWDDRTDDETINKVLAALVRAGYTAEEEATAETVADGEKTTEKAPQEATEPMVFTVKVPTVNHTGNALRNLINLIYTRASLINKALGTAFAAEQGLVEDLGENENLRTVEDFYKTLAAYEKEHGPALKGIAVTENEIAFSFLPETPDADLITAFSQLTAMMDTQAVKQKRIQAKKVADENEKYALRIWLTRLGMNGSEYKTTRKVLMKNLSGDSAFRTEAEKEKWKANRAAESAAEEVNEG